MTVQQALDQMRLMIAEKRARLERDAEAVRTVTDALASLSRHLEAARAAIKETRESPEPLPKDGDESDDSRDAGG